MTPDLDAYVQRVRDMIEEHGWIIQGVHAGDGNPQYHYSVGLWPSAGFELMAVGLPYDAGQLILNALARRVLDGLRFTHGQVLDDVLAGYPATMIEIPVTGAYMGVANRLYRLGGINIPAWQLVYPDAIGRWPWEPDSEVSGEPVLGEIPVVDHKPKGS